MKLQWITAIAFLALAAACTQPVEEPAEDTSADVESIEQVRDEFVRATNAADVESLVALFTEDAMRMPPDEPVVSGSDEIRRDIQTRLQQGSLEISIPVDETRIIGDHAYSRGTYQIMITLADGSTVEENGSWVNVMKRQEEGDWKIYLNIWNRDHAPVTPGEQETQAP